MKSVSSTADTRGVLAVKFGGITSAVVTYRKPGLLCLDVQTHGRLIPEEIAACLLRYDHKTSLSLSNDN